MSPGIAAAALGAVADLGTSLMAQFFGRRKTAAETQKLQAEAAKIRAETAEIQSRIKDPQEELESRVANAEAFIEHDRGKIAGRIRQLTGRFQCPRFRARTVARRCGGIKRHVEWIIRVGSRYATSS